MWAAAGEASDECFVKIQVSYFLKLSLVELVVVDEKRKIHFWLRKERVVLVMLLT